MLLAQIRPDNTIVADSQRRSSWKDKYEPSTSLAKTAEHNTFLSLLSSTRQIHQRKPTMQPAEGPTMKTQMPTATKTNNLKRLSREPPPFALDPKKRTSKKLKGHSSVRVESLSSDTEQSASSSGEDSGSDSKDSPPQKSRLTHPDVDMLADEFQNQIILKDQAIAAAKAIVLPRAFELEHPITPLDVLEEKAKVHSHLKRKRKREESPAWPTADRAGYDPGELLLRGAIALPQCQSSTLDNEIHPLLARSQFDDTPDFIYDQIIPALRLASRWLSHPSCMQFWVTLAFGKRTHDKSMSAKFGRPCQRIAEHVPMTAANTREVIELLHSLGTSNIIQFRFQERLRANGSRIYGVSLPICSRTSEHTAHQHKGTQHKKLTASLIRLHSDIYVSAYKLAQLTFPEPSQALRFQFFVATLLLHELAHSIEGAYIRHRPDQHTHFINEGVYVEPFWLDWTRVPEMGRAWEATTLGGEVQPINWRVDGGCGIGASAWPPQGSAGDKDRRVWSGIGMSYIESLFQNAKWQESADVKNGKDADSHAGNGADWVRIPTDGARSLYMNFFTTMTGEEALRVKQEEAREALEKARDMPPDKIRVKASGGKEEKRKEAEAVIKQAVKEIEHVNHTVTGAEEAVQSGVIQPLEQDKRDNDRKNNDAVGASSSTMATIRRKHLGPSQRHWQTTRPNALSLETSMSLASSREIDDSPSGLTSAQTSHSSTVKSLSTPASSQEPESAPREFFPIVPAEDIVPAEAITILTQEYPDASDYDDEDDEDYKPPIDGKGQGGRDTAVMPRRRREAPTKQKSTKAK